MHPDYSPVPRPPNDDDDTIDNRRHGQHSASSSVTEVDEALLSHKWEDDREQEAKVQPTTKSRSRRAFRMLWNIVHAGLDTFLLMAILLLVLRQQLLTRDPNPWDFGGDLTGVGPRLDQQITKFQSDQSYSPMNSSEFFTDEVLQKWNQLMPIGMGFVWVNDTHRYHDLPKPIDWPEKTVFTTSVTHQIHCLFTIAQTYAGLKTGRTLPSDHHWHMTHCLDYMREAVLCNADIALEGHETTFPDDNGGSDGWDSKHICKDYSQVKAYLESVRAYDDQLIY